MSTNLGGRFAKAMQLPPTGQADYFDTELKGLGLRVSAGGTKTWFVNVAVADNPAMKEDTICPSTQEVPSQWYDDYGRALVLHDPNLAFINEFRLQHGVAELEGIAGGMGTLRCVRWSSPSS